MADMDPVDVRLSKLLAYLLRYGARRERLPVDDKDYVPVQALLEHRPLRRLFSGTERHAADPEGHVVGALLDCLANSRSEKIGPDGLGVRRFELGADSSGAPAARAAYGRRLARADCHEGSRVDRLAVAALRVVADNVHMYDFAQFACDTVLNSIMSRLKETRRLNNRTLRQLAVPGLGCLDLRHVSYISESTLRQVANNCRRLSVLRLCDCGYLLNDHLLAGLLCRTGELRVLDVSGCAHLNADVTVDTVCRCCAALRVIDLSRIATANGTEPLRLRHLVKLLAACTQLVELTAYDIDDDDALALQQLHDAVRPPRRMLKVDIGQPLNRGTADATARCRASP